MDYSLLVGVTRKSFDVLRDEYSRISKSARSDSFLSTGSFNSTPPATSSEVKGDVFMRDKDGGMDVVMVHGPATYYIGIIDILQQWNWRKKVERFLKTVVLRRDGDGLSALDPQRYTARFMSRCVEDVFENLNIADVDDFLPKKFANRLHARDSAVRSSLQSHALVTENPLYATRHQQRVSEENDENDDDEDQDYRGGSGASASAGAGVSLSSCSRNSSAGHSRENDDTPRHANSWGKEISHDV